MASGTSITDGGVSVANDATAAPLSTAPWSVPTRGLAISGLETATGLMRVCRVNALGQLIVAGGGGGGGTPVPNEGAVTFQAFAPGAGIATQGPNQAVPDGFAMVIKNRSTTPAGIVFVANSLANCAISTARLELSKGESASFYITNMNLLFFQCELDSNVAEFYSEV